MELKIFLVFLKRWIWLILLGAILGAGGGYLFSQYQTPVYRASSRVLITGDLLDTQNVSGRQSLQELVGTYTQLLLTQSTASIAAERLSYPVNLGRISVRAIPNTKLFEVTYLHQDRERAAETVNILIEVLIEQNDTLQNNRIISSASGLKSQIDEVSLQIEDLEQELADNYQLLREQREAELSSQIDERETAVSNLNREILNLTVLYQQENLAAVPTVTPDPETGFQPTPLPPLLTLEQQSTLNEKQSQLDNLESELARYQQAYFDLIVLGIFEPGQETAEGIRLNQRQAELALYQQLYSDLLSEYELARMTNMNATTSVVQVDPAVAPGNPLRPRPFTDTIIGATLGLLFAGVVGFVIEYMDDSIKSDLEIQEIFDVPVLGRILQNKTVSKNQEVHAAIYPRSPITETFRSLRTNIEFARIDEPLKSILITSANPGEGKTTIVSNLAAVMAQAGQKVLVIDADLRRPTIHEYFGVSNQIGLTNVLIGQAEVNKAIQKVEDGYIMVLPSGPIPPNPAELLRSNTMSQLIDELGNLADIILIDSPPVIVSDPAVLASKVSGVLIVIHHGKTRKGVALDMLKQLQGVQARIIGVVLNSITGGSLSGYYYSNYYDSSFENGRGNGQGAAGKKTEGQVQSIDQPD